MFNILVEMWQKGDGNAIMWKEVPMIFVEES